MKKKVNNKKGNAKKSTLKTNINNKKSTLKTNINNKKSTLKKKGKEFKKKKASEKILTILMLGLISVTSIAILFMLYVIITSPEFSEDALYTKESSIIYSTDEEEYARIGLENRDISTYDDLPDVLIDAILATEDSRFMQHSGVDLARFIVATLGQLTGNKGAGGASTLTMQIVKQRFTDDTATGIKGIIRKFTDVYMAVFKIEKNYTKEQILEFYVNIPWLGSGAYGVEQASQMYFGKSVSDVTLTEAAILAGLFQAPSAYDPYISPEKTTNRRNRVLDLMERHDYITKEEANLAKSIPVTSLLASDAATVNQNQGVIDTIVQEVIDRTGQNPYLVSMKIYSTINPAKQEVVNNVNNGTSVKWRNEMLQTGIAVIDVETGGIAAIGAGRNKTRELGFNFATMINRHPGSTAKPLFDFGPAIEYLNWGTGTTIVDDVHGYTGGSNIKNWDNSYMGIMTIKKALAASRNIPSLQAFQAVPQAQINQFVTGLGLHPEYENGYINESHSIGGYTGSNPVELAAAYATFARGGVYIEPHSFTKIIFEKTGETYIVTPEKRTVMKDSTAYMINNILRFAVTNGHVVGGNVSGTDLAGKTGTSTVDRDTIKKLGINADVIGDSWQVGYSPDYSIAIWIGYEQLISKEYYLTNNVGRDTRNAVIRALNTGIHNKNSRFKVPTSIVTATIELETIPLQLASEHTPDNLKSVEYFRKGTAPSEVSDRFTTLDKVTNLKVTYSSGKSTLSWDPVKIPNAVSGEYLTQYFADGYGKWATKYLNQRISYNASNIGNIGYQVYLDTGSGLKDLGWTSSTTFTHNENIPSGSKFVVKTAYSIFKKNMSSGAEVTAGEGTTQQTISVKLNTGNCLNLNSYLGNSNIFSVYEGLNDVTSSSTITYTCYSNGTTVDCSTMNNTSNYEIKPNVKYNNKTIQNNLILNINPAC